jgi:two-component system, LytTR family, response regulator
MKPVRTWIVDDEALSRERLRSLLALERDFELAGESCGGREAVRSLREQRPELVFLDVQMPEVDGFGVLQALDARDLPVIVFVTAYDRHALAAFEVHAIDYLLKPFDRERFRRTLEYVREHVEAVRRGEPDPRFAALRTNGTARYLERFTLRRTGSVALLRADEVDWIEAAGNYVRLHSGGRTHVVRETLSRIEQRLDPRRFVRSHRSAIVHVERVRAIEPLFHGDAVLVLETGARVPMSRSFRERVQRALG